MIEFAEAASCRNFGITVLGSGSKGNSSVIHGTKGNFLLDAGFSAKELAARMEDRDIDPCSIQAILVTHAHQDHTKGCRVFGKKYNIPVYIQQETYLELKEHYEKYAPEEGVVLITPGAAFDCCGVHIEPFEISHDVAAIAYIFQVEDHKIGYATDLGWMSPLVKRKLHDSQILILESNYDPVKLRNSGRPISTIRRIMGRQGHLSNDEAMSSLGDLITKNTRKIVFAHISQECNDRVLVNDLAMKQLADLNREDILVEIASQSTPLETMWMKV